MPESYLRILNQNFFCDVREKWRPCSGAFHLFYRHGLIPFFPLGEKSQVTPNQHKVLQPDHFYSLFLTKHFYPDGRGLQDDCSVHSGSLKAWTRMKIMWIVWYGPHSHQISPTLGKYGRFGGDVLGSDFHHHHHQNTDRGNIFWKKRLHCSNTGSEKRPVVVQHLTKVYVCTYINVSNCFILALVVLNSRYIGNVAGVTVHHNS